MSSKKRSKPALRSESDEREGSALPDYLTNRVFDFRPLLARARGLLVCIDSTAQVRLHFLREVLRLTQRVADLWETRAHELEEAPLPAAYVLRRHVVEEAVRDGVDDHHLLLDGHRLILPLLQHFDGARAAVELALRGGVEVRRECRECLELAVLCEIEAQAPGDLPHRLDLRRATDARHRDADVDRGPDAREKEIRFEEDLPVGDRDDVRRNVRRHVAGLRFDQRQRGERAAGLENVRTIDDAGVLAQLRGALEQS